MLEKTVELIRKWQQAGHEAIVCDLPGRGGDEGSRVPGWGKRFTLVNSDLSTAEFGSGVMVLPVEYTKGLGV